MGQWIVEQMDSITLDDNFSVLSRRLVGLNLWLERIRGDRRIAFSVVGVKGQQPFMMLISNFVDLDGWVVDACPQLRTYMRTPNQRRFAPWEVSVPTCLNASGWRGCCR
jgi:hypothetical protein